MKKFYAMMIAVMVCFTSAYAEPELKGSPDELTAYLSGIPDTVSITGTSELKVQADNAIVILIIKTESKSLVEALKTNQNICAQIRKELKKLGIDPLKIRSTKFASTPHEGYFSDKIKSYEVEKALKIVVEGEEEVQQVASLVDQYREIYYGGIQFENSKESEFKRKALSQACEAAVRKKTLFEEKLGITLVTKKFHGGSVTKQLPDMNRMPLNTLSKMANISMTDVGEPNGAISRFDEIIYRASVTVDYQLKTLKK